MVAMAFKPTMLVAGFVITQYAQSSTQQVMAMAHNITFDVDVNHPFAKTCQQYATRGWWGRFMSFTTPQEIHRLNKHQEIGAAVFAMDGGSLAALCNSKDMDDILLGIGYSDSTIEGMKASTPVGLPMTLVTWYSDEEFPSATWQNVLKKADEMLVERLGKEGRLRDRFFPNLTDSKWAKKLNASTSPVRKFQFGEPEKQNGTKIFPVDGELMNLDIAMERGFAVDDEKRCVSQLRSFLYSEIHCNSEFKGDGFTWNFKSGANAWGSSKGKEYLASNFDIHMTEKPHHEVIVDLPWESKEDDHSSMTGIVAGVGFAEKGDQTQPVV